MSKSKISVIALALLAATPVFATEKRIKLKHEGNSYYVPVLINKKIWLDFLIDTGAGEVTIPADVGLTLARSGSIADSDFGAEKTYALANGSTTKAKQLRFSSLQRMFPPSIMDS